MRNLRWGQKRASHTDNKKVFFRCTLFLVVVVADVDADSHRREVAESAGHAVSFSRNSFSHSLVSGQGER